MSTPPSTNLYDTLWYYNTQIRSKVMSVPALPHAARRALFSRFGRASLSRIAPRNELEALLPFKGEGLRLLFIAAAKWLGAPRALPVCLPVRVPGQCRPPSPSANRAAEDLPRAPRLPFPSDNPLTIQRMRDLDIAGKRVLISQDSNVPDENADGQTGTVTSDLRIT